MSDLPRLKIWGGRDPFSFFHPGLNGAVFEFGIIWKSLPREQQVEGELIRARFAARLRIALPAFQWCWTNPRWAGQWGTYPSYLWTGRHAKHDLKMVHGLRVSFLRWS